MYVFYMVGEPPVDVVSPPRTVVLLNMYKSLLLPEAGVGGLCSFSTPQRFDSG